MLERLANVIYWTCNGIALTITGFTAWWYTSTASDHRLGTVIIAALAATFIYLIGRAVRYVINGR